MGYPALSPLAAFFLLLGVAECLSRGELRGHLRRAGVLAGLQREEKLHSRESAGRVEVRKAKGDQREYVQASFDNGLEVLVVSDPAAEKNAFAVAVGAGSLEDPEDFQGLAHFCEHMLFLGSDKYPDQETFTQHLATYGGNHNAYTSSEATVYFNEISPAGFEKGLDIFAQFFISPSFNRSMVDKEIHAVDSEHKKNMPSVTRKIWNLLHSRASKENPQHKFSTGNLETLKLQPEKDGKDLVTALEKFHKENYCPKRLHAVLVGKQTTEQLIESAHKAFDAVPKNDACTPRPVYKAPAFSEDLKNVGDRLTLHTQGTPEMWVQFPMLPALHEQYKSLPQEYILNAMGHYGPGGLKAALLAENLAPSFAPMMDSSVAGSAMLFRFMLTPKGTENPDRVLELLFAYINSVRREGVVDEKEEAMRQWREVSFDYQAEASSEFELVQSLGGSVSQGYAPEDLLTGGYLIDTPNKTASMKVIESLSPRHMNVIMVDPKFSEAKANKEEHHYQVKYLQEPLGEELITRLEAANQEGMGPPHAPRYVPTELGLVKEGSGKTPKRLFEEGRVAVWWKGMNLVKLPKGDVQLKLGFSTELTESIEGAVLAGIFSRLVSRVLEGPTDEMQMCGLGYGIAAYHDGVGVHFSGFDQHMEEMMKVVLPVVRDLQFEEKEFEAIRQQSLLALKDDSKAEPYQHAMQAFEVVSTKGSFAKKEKVAALADTKKINPAALKAFLTKLFAQAELTMLFSGNIAEQRATTMAALIEEKLQITRKQKKVSHDSVTNVLKPRDTVEVRVANPIVGDPNSATFVAYQVGIPNIEDRVKLLLISDIIGDPVFATLRTKHQLGYVVFGYATVHHNSVAEIRVLVQGFRKDPDAVEPLVESTVKNITQVLTSMKASEFEQRKKTAQVALAKPDKTLGEEVSGAWGPIWQGQTCFDKKEKMLAALEKMGSSTEPLVEMWQKAITPGPERRKIAVKLFGGAEGAALKASNSSTTNHMLANKADGLTLVTVVDSKSLKKELEGEQYWPDQSLCE